MQQQKQPHTCPQCSKPTSKYQLKRFGTCYACHKTKGRTEETGQ